MLMLYVATETWEAASTTCKCCGWLVVLHQTSMALHHLAVFVNSILHIMTLLTSAHAVCWSTFRFWTLKGLSEKLLATNLKNTLKNIF